MKDYDHQNLSSVDHGVDYNIGKHFFTDDSEDYFDVYTMSVANKTGKTSFKTLVEFIASTIFPDNGTWINFDIMSSQPTPEEVQLKHEIERDMKKKIDESNFYKEIIKNIADGIAYQKGYMDIRYNHGVHFVPSSGDDLVISQAKGATARAYALSYMSSAELITDFKGLPDHIANAENVQELNEKHRVLVALIPNTKVFLSETQQSDNRFVKVYILWDDRMQIYSSAEVSNPGYKSWPIMEYQPYTNTSLCEDALTYCVYADYFQKIDRDQEELVTWPTMAVDERNVLENTANFRPGGTIPVTQGHVMPQAVQTLTGGNITNAQKILTLEAKIKHIFKVDIIEGLLTQGLSVFEYHNFQAKVLSAIKPTIGSLNKSYISGLLSRVHNICLQYDKRYNEKYKGLMGDFGSSSLDEVITKAEFVGKLGQIVQISAGAIQHMPGIGKVFNDTDLGIWLAEAFNVQGALKSPEEVKEEQEAEAQQEKDAQAQETDTMAADAELSRAKASEAKQQGE